MLTRSSPKGSHRAVPVRFRWLRSWTPVEVPTQRRTDVDVVDALTKLTHRVSPEELVAGHQRGNYQARCGTRFHAASLVEPGRGYCPDCVREAIRWCARS